ncbi:MAG: outer-membrane lipoprotein carrier protein LolA [Polyangiaceae bacterium]
MLKRPTLTLALAASLLGCSAESTPISPTQVQPESLASANATASPQAPPEKVSAAAATSKPETGDPAPERVADGTASPAAEKKAAEKKAAEKKAAEKKAAEKRLAEKKAAEKRLAEKKAAEKRLAEKKAAEKKLAEKKLAEKKLAEKSPTKLTSHATATLDSNTKPSPKAGTANAVAAKVDVIYGPVKNFRARFKQKYVAKVAGRTKTSAGVVYIQRPNKVSFSYNLPNKNRVVSNGKVLKIYEHEGGQMFVKPVAQTEYPGALAFIMGEGLLASFSFAFHPTATFKGGRVLVGTPLKHNPAYKVVLFYIDDALLAAGDTACIRRVLVLDAQGNRNRFDFIHVEEPAQIPAKEFEFTPPAGTAIHK